VTDRRAPRRWKTIEELNVGEHVQRMNALRAGDPEPRFEREEYRLARREALDDAGFADDDADDQALEDMTAADHARQIREETR
jgi:hypothetical protein